VESAYVFDNAAGQAGERFAILEACYDPTSVRHLEVIGVGEGWQCLEVGGGGGSIGRWLSERVGPAGRVLVTDLDTRWMDGPTPGNLEVRHHDIVRDELPEEGFDLVHARLVLMHLPERARALRRMISALKPGGWVLIEEFDFGWLPLRAQGDPGAVQLFDKVRGACEKVLEDAGVDCNYGHKVYRPLLDEGLGEVGAEGYMQMWRGASPGIDLHRANTEQLHDRLLASGLVNEGDLDVFRQLLADPSFVVSSNFLISTWGRRPELLKCERAHH
jgi:SAM-dependent methyltransferase